MIAEFLDSLLSHGYLQKALITSVIVGVACGIVGSFIAVSYTHLRAHET